MYTGFSYICKRFNTAAHIYSDIFVYFDAVLTHLLIKKLKRLSYEDSLQITPAFTAGRYVSHCFLRLNVFKIPYIQIFGKINMPTSSKINIRAFSGRFIHNFYTSI